MTKLIVDFRNFADAPENSTSTLNSAVNPFAVNKCIVSYKLSENQGFKNSYVACIYIHFVDVRWLSGSQKLF